MYPDHCDELPEKLTSKLSKLDFREYALDMNDDVFKYMNLEG